MTKQINPNRHCPKKRKDVEKAMKNLDKLIQRVNERGTWKGVDVDEYLKMVRGL